MVNKGSLEGLVKILEILFNVCFMLYAILSYNSLTYGTVIISLVMWPVVVVGLFLLAYRIVYFKQYITTPLIITLMAFFISFILSTVINYQFELKQNIINGLFLAFYFFLLYANDRSVETKKVLKEFQIVSVVFLLYMFISVAISLTFMVTGYGNVRKLADGYEVVSGFVWGRLYGVFLDPNCGAVMACVSIYLTLFFMSKVVRKSVKALGAINILLMLSFIAFSDSRTGRLCLGITSGIYLYCFFIKRKKDGIGKWGYFRIILISVAAVAVMTSVPKGIAISYNTVQGHLTTEHGDLDKIERAYDLEQDPSNRRFDIWKSGIEIFNQNKFWGTSYNGIRPYARENMPQTYIVNNSQTDFKNLHNEFLNVLVSQGIIGGSLLVILVIKCCSIVFLKLFKVKTLDFPVTCVILISLLCIGIESMLVAAGMFYYNVPSTNLFWMYLGYLIYFLQKEDCKKYDNVNNERRHWS